MVARPHKSQGERRREREGHCAQLLVQSAQAIWIGNFILPLVCSPPTSQLPIHRAWICCTMGQLLICNINKKGQKLVRVQSETIKKMIPHKGRSIHMCVINWANTNVQYRWWPLVRTNPSNKGNPWHGWMHCDCSEWYIYRITISIRINSSLSNHWLIFAVGKCFVWRRTSLTSFAARKR